MQGIRLSGVPVTPGTIDNLLREWFGYQVEERDGEWWIPESDSALRDGPPQILTMHPRIELNPDRFPEIADKMISAVPDDFDEYVNPPPANVDILGTLGVLSELNCATTETELAPPPALKRVLVEKLLPLLTTEFKATNVVPVSLSAGMQQQYFSFAKVSLLTQLFGGGRLEELLHDKNAFSGIEITGALDILGFVDALTRLIPIAFSLPVRRRGCTWHFYGDGFFPMKSLACHGLFQDFLRGINPRSADIVMGNLDGLHSFREENAWRLIRAAVLGINRLMSFLNNPLTFTNHHGKTDFLLQLKSYGAVHMLFADLLAVNYSINPHSQISFSFAFMDKLANLRKHLGGASGGEGTLAKDLASLRFGKAVRGVIGRELGIIHEDLAKSFLPVVRSCYWHIHRHLGREIGRSGKVEAKRLSRLRSMRNLNHGAFLQDDKFNEVFFEATGTVPPSLAALPYILALGLVLSPKEFLTL
jgi:hypothetical protein